MALMVQLIKFGYISWIYFSTNGEVKKERTSWPLSWLQPLEGTLSADCVSSGDEIMSWISCLASYLCMWHLYAILWVRVRQRLLGGAVFFCSWSVSTVQILKVGKPFIVLHVAVFKCYFFNNNHNCPSQPCGPWLNYACKPPPIQNMLQCCWGCVEHKTEWNRCVVSPRHLPPTH